MGEYLWWPQSTIPSLITLNFFSQHPNFFSRHFNFFSHYRCSFVSPPKLLVSLSSFHKALPLTVTLRWHLNPIDPEHLSSNMRYFPRISPGFPQIPSRFPQNLEQLSIFKVLPTHIICDTTRRKGTPRGIW